MHALPLPEPGPDQAIPVVDVVIPVHNEQAALAASLERLHAYLSEHLPFTWRITIVDNASDDDTWSIAQGLAARLDHVVALHLGRKGRGLALRTAWTGSDAAIVAYMDVDLSTDLDAFLPLVAPLVSGHSDVAIGSRLAPGAKVARGPKRELISRAYNRLLRTVFATNVRDAQCGFKAVRADVAHRLLPAIEDESWFFDTELLLLAEHNGLRIHEVPVDWVDDPDSRVKIASTAIGDLLGSARMMKTFLSGRGRVDLGGASREELDDDFGRRVVTFGSIGAVSTLVSLALFLVLHDVVGPIGANFVAVSTTFVANTWTNARLTARRRRPNLRGSLLLYLGALALTSGALLLVDALDGGLGLEVVAVLTTWSIAAVARFALVDTWSRTAERR